MGKYRNVDVWIRTGYYMAGISWLCLLRQLEAMALPQR